MDNEIRLATWNVRTLLRPGGRNELLDTLARYNVDITALQEVRFGGSDILRDRKRKGDIYFSGKKDQGMYGVGFAVRGDMRNSVMGWIPVNERICVIRLKGTFYNICIICAYAPTDKSNSLTKQQLETKKDIFYDQLDAALDACPKHDAKYVVGDFNAQVGKEGIYRGIIGLHSLHDYSSDNGCRLINFAASRELVISSTCFHHKRIHKGTWTSADGRVVNQIDHVLTDSRHASNVMDVRSYRGANIDSDHFLVIAKLRARISMTKCARPQSLKGFNIEALKSNEASFAREVTQRLQHVQTNEPVEEFWGQCSSALTTAATDVLGPIQRRPKKEWFDADCTKVTNEKNAERLKWLGMKNTRGAGIEQKEVYKAARRRAVQLCRAKKRSFEDNEMRKVELLCGRGDSRKFYQQVKRQREGYAPPSIFCNDASGNLLVNDDDILSRWREYFSELLGNDDTRDTPGEEAELPGNDTRQSRGEEDEIPPPSLAEINAAIGKLKANKSPGSDGIPAELIKSAGDSFVEYLHQLF